MVTDFSSGSLLASDLYIPFLVGGAFMAQMGGAFMTNGWGSYGSNGWGIHMVGAFMTQMGGAVMAKWVIFGRYAQKHWSIQDCHIYTSFF